MQEKIKGLLTTFVTTGGDESAVLEALLQDEKNKREISKLRAKGYSEDLWRKGIFLETEALPASEARQLEKLNEKISQEAHQIIEVAQELNFTPDGMSSEEIAELIFTSYEEANTFIETMKKAVAIPKTTMENLVQLLSNIKLMEAEANDIVVSAEPTKVTVVIKKDFFAEANAGVGVPGCFAPTGIHKEMPLAHALESNAAFALVYDNNGTMVANTVLAFTDKGVVVFGEYSSRLDLDLSTVWLEAWGELSRFVPAVILPPKTRYNAIAGRRLAEKRNIGTKQSAIATKRGTHFGPMYYDFGKTQGNGDWSMSYDDAVILTHEMFASHSEEKPERPETKVEDDDVEDTDTEEQILRTLEKKEKKQVSSTLFKLNLDVNLQPVLSRMEMFILQATDEEVVALLSDLKTRDNQAEASRTDRDLLLKTLQVLRTEFKLKKAFQYLVYELQRRVEVEEVINEDMVRTILYSTLVEKMDLDLRKLERIPKGRVFAGEKITMSDEIRSALDSALNKALRQETILSRGYEDERDEELFGEYVPREEESIARGEIRILHDGMTRVAFTPVMPVYDQNLFPEREVVLQFEIYQCEGNFYVEVVDLISKDPTNIARVYQILESFVQYIADYVDESVTLTSETAAFLVRTRWDGETFKTSERSRDVSSRLGWHSVKEIQSQIKRMWIEIVQPVLAQTDVRFEDMSTEGINQKNFRYYEKVIVPSKSVPTTISQSVTGIKRAATLPETKRLVERYALGIEKVGTELAPYVETFGIFSKAIFWRRLSKIAWKDWLTDRDVWTITFKSPLLVAGFTMLAFSFTNPITAIIAGLVGIVTALYFGQTHEENEGLNTLAGLFFNMPFFITLSVAPFIALPFYAVPAMLYASWAIHWGLNTWLGYEKQMAEKPAQLRSAAEESIVMALHRSHGPIGMVENGANFILFVGNFIGGIFMKVINKFIVIKDKDGEIQIKGKPRATPRGVGTKIFSVAFLGMIGTWFMNVSLAGATEIAKNAPDAAVTSISTMFLNPLVMGIVGLLAMYGIAFIFV
ncbi:MAG: hypothetical protein DRP85_09325, partial [Candidatus Makaraimicrobium thalassicum]